MKDINSEHCALSISGTTASVAKVVDKHRYSPTEPAKNVCVASTNNRPINNELGGKASPTSVTLAPNVITRDDVLGGCDTLLTSPGSLEHGVKRLIADSRPPLLYIGIIMTRPAGYHPSTPFSWGFSMIKEKRYVHVVGLNPTGHPPATKFCRITNQAPPSIVYNSGSSEDCEVTFMRSFPPAWKDSSCSAPSLSDPCLHIGDAIISINGVSVSKLESTAKVASFIRQRCQEKLMIVAQRHETVWRAGWEEITTKFKLFPSVTQARNADQEQQQQQLHKMIKDSVAAEQRRRVVKAINEAWMRVQEQREWHQVKRKKYLQPSSSKRSKFDSLVFHTVYTLADTRQLTNEAFRDRRGLPILYSDNEDFDPDDGRRFRMFATRDVNRSFDDWLLQRKVEWKKYRKVICRTDNEIAGQKNEAMTVPHDFWLANGYESFDQWLSGSKAKWRRSYSWHKDRRMKLQTETEKEVHFPSVGPITSHVPSEVALNLFHDWFVVRKQQWRIIRRRLHLQRRGSSVNEVSDASSCKSDNAVKNSNCFNHVKSRRSGPRGSKVSASNDTMIIDEMLEDQQRHERQREINLSPLDISWIFDADMSAPDDVIVLLMRFLNPCDHGNLLCLSWGSNYSFKKRDVVWQSLCPKRWILPRRPRKSWCVMYITKIRAEEEASRKQSDDLLMRADAIIDKGDQLNKLKSLVLKAEKDFSFDVNYTSGTVLERNSLLNMAVINGRKNIAKWLIEEKDSDVETCDRGNFTPLLNAAWNGDKYLVRYLLGKGSDRKKIGTFHSSRGMASSHFQGKDAEGWARERGYIDVADLIRFGL